jgi:hypothetical protein
MKFFQIFERFTNLPSTGVKIASNTQGTAIAAIRFVLRMDLRRETSPEGTRRVRKRRKSVSHHILCKGPTVVGSARKCMRFNPLERTGESLTCEISTSFGPSIKRHVVRSYSIARSGIESWTSKGNCSPKTPIRDIAKSREDL